MRVKARYRQEDVARLQAKLRALPDAVKAPIRRELDATGGRIQRSAVRRAPKDEGALRAGISIQVLDGGLKLVISALRIATRGKLRANIAWFVEFGTVKMPARPFLLPAYRASRSGLQRRMRVKVREALGLMARRK